MKTLLPVLVGVTLALASAAGSAQDTDTDALKLSIERKSLRDALNDWAQQTGYQLIAEIRGEFVAPKIEGRLTAQEALERLLRGTPLTYQWMGERLVAVKEKSLVVPAALRKSEAEGKHQSVPISRFSGEGWRGQRLAANDQSVARTDEPAGSERGTRDAEGAEELEEIVVTGSRLSFRKDEGPAPVTVLDRKRIDQLGATSIADVLEYLPQQSFSSSEGSTFGGTRVVQLRGLGLGTTLVLINGRRTATSALLGDFSAFDLNSVPLAAVERIEILSDSASAVYGADAVGGVVNIVLKNNARSPLLEFYGGTADEGARERRASGTFGYVNDRSRAQLFVDVFDRDYLRGEDRSFYANQDFSRFGGTDNRSTLAYPANISSLTGDNLPGLPSPIAAVPRGSSGIGLTPADFLATAGTSNLESTTRFQSVVPKAERISAMASVSLNVTDRTTLFGEVLYTDRNDTAISIPPYILGVVPAENPFNPFSVPVFAARLVPELPLLRAKAESELFRGVVGASGDFGAWNWELSTLGIEDKGSSSFVGLIDQSLVAPALADPNPANTLNVFSDGAPASGAVLNSLLATPSENRNSSRALQASGFLRGPVFTLPTGPVDLVIGSETRSERMHFEQNASGILLSADRRSTAVYSELRVPLVREDVSHPPLTRLELTLAGRYDRYNDFGSSFNPEFGLQWKPVPQLLLRGSYGTSFRPPSLYELYAPVTSTPSIVADSRRSTEFAIVDSISGGNADLDPEEAESYTVGFVSTLESASSPRIAAAYWRIQQTDRIQPLQPDVLIANEGDFPGRVVRAEPTAEDLAAGIPGALISVDSTGINFGELTTSGIDLELSKQFGTPAGTITPVIAATHVLRYEAKNTPNTRAVDRVGIASSLGTIPDWRATGTLAWNLNSWSVAVSARYVSSYKDVLSDVPNGRTVADQTLVDLQASCSFDAVPAPMRLLDGVTIRAGIINLFDSGPRYSEVSAGGVGFDPSQADTRQRFGYLSVVKSF